MNDKKVVLYVIHLLMFFYVADGHIVDVDRVNQLNKKQFKIECCRYGVSNQNVEDFIYKYIQRKTDKELNYPIYKTEIKITITFRLKIS